MILMIDNYDSFTYNIVQYFGELQQDITVWRNDQTTIENIRTLAPDAIVIGPGPCDPDQAGISSRSYQDFSGRDTDTRYLPRTSGNWTSIRWTSGQGWRSHAWPLIRRLSY